jgi:hypothetical protein
MMIEERRKGWKNTAAPANREMQFTPTPQIVLYGGNKAEGGQP